MRVTAALSSMRASALRPTASSLIGVWSRAGSCPSTRARSRLFCSSSRRLEEHRIASERPAAEFLSPRSSPKAPSDFAFAFDIDGVLYRGGNKIPGAGKTLEWLASEDIRYVFLTNGGGNHEHMKAESLRKKLDVAEETIGTRVIQSHTPMQGWPAHIKKNDTILITGQHPHWAREVAHSYGFKNVITPNDVEWVEEHIYPFQSPRDMMSQKSEGGELKMPSGNSLMTLPDGKRPFVPNDPYETDIPPWALKIDHIFVWNDPRDWSFDIQIIHDALVSNEGYIGTLSPKNGDKSLPNNGWQQGGQPSLWISNLDLLWKTEYPISRFGTGAFVEALKAVWRAATDGAELQYEAFGKPLQRTYEYAQHKLVHMNHKGQPTEQPTPIKRVYMIGDNPESDIRGANEFEPEDGTEWKSILVRTGVWSPTALESEPRYKPDVIVDSVADAIVWAMKNEGVEIPPGHLKDN